MPPTSESGHRLSNVTSCDDGSPVVQPQVVDTEHEKKRKLNFYLFVFMVITVQVPGILDSVIGGPVLINYFAAQRNHSGPIVCDVVNQTSVQLQALCTLANGDAASYGAGVQTASSIVSVLGASFFGTLSDSLGRRPILVAAMLLMLGSAVGLASTVWFNTTPFVSGGFMVLLNFLQPMPVFLACISDWFSPEERLQKYGFVFGVATFCIVLAPLSTILMSPRTVTVVAIGVVLAGLAVLVPLEEPLPKELRKPMQGFRTVNPLSGIALLFSTPLFRALTLVLCLHALGNTGANFFTSFIMLPETFKVTQLGIVISVLGVGGAFAQGVLLPLLMRCIKERRILQLVLLVQAPSCLLLVFPGLYGNMAVLYAFALLSGLSSLVLTVVAALKSVNVGDDQQGQVQGALYTLNGLMGVIGNLGFGVLYKETTAPSNFHPGAIFLLASGFTLLALLASFFLPRQENEGPPRLLKRFRRRDGPMKELEGTLGESLL